MIDYQKEKDALAIGGSWIVKKELVHSEAWDETTPGRKESAGPSARQNLL